MYTDTATVCVLLRTHSLANNDADFTPNVDSHCITNEHTHNKPIWRADGSTHYCPVSPPHSSPIRLANIPADTSSFLASHPEPHGLSVPGAIALSDV